MSTTKDLTYLIRIQKYNKSVFVVALGINRVDAEVEGCYSSTEALPEWMQEKLALLMMLHCTPDINTLDGVGSKIGDWEYNITT